MGGGKGSTSTQVEMTPEQREQIKLQTEALRSTFLPAYKETVSGAKNVYGRVAPAAEAAAGTASDVAGAAGALQGAVGAQSYLTGTEGLKKLFSNDYKTQQIEAAMQPAREEIREQVGSQNAIFGGAGGGTGARAALARENLKQLGEQRLGTVAATTSADIENRRQQAAGTLLSAGASGLSEAQKAAMSRVGLAQVPQDVYSKYASIVYGVPQTSTTSNFAGTQSQKQESKGFGF